MHVRARFATTRETLLWVPNSYFTKLLGGDFATVLDEEGAVRRVPWPMRALRAHASVLRPKR